jgi:predicted DCC family thiol-disulfide oxidoreductase YuxK
VTVPVVHFVVRGEESSVEISLGRPWTVVWDGSCKICSRLARLIQAWDRRHVFNVVTSQTPGVKANFPWIPERAYLESVQVIGPHGETKQGAAALEQILDLLPKGWFFSWVFSIPFVRPAAERFYRWFAKNRYRLGCGEHCAYKPNADVDYGE